MRRLGYALLAAALIALDVLLIYVFFVHLWPVLPGWAVLLFFVALAVFVIGSPILWLLRLSRNTPIPEEWRGKRGR